MSISELCSCGASFQAERSDELKLLNAWRINHKCVPTEGSLAIIDTSRSELASYHPIGFVPFQQQEEEDE